MGGQAGQADTGETRTPLPLDGIRVLDLSRVLAGPWCTMTLGDLGAEIIKIENPKSGDDTRAWFPPSAGGEAAYYLCANRNKKSIALNLAAPAGQEIIRDIARVSDIVVENFRTGTLARYGLDYDSLSALNPRLIYCSISGYGRVSPMADKPGYDFIAQAEGGLMSLTGPADGEPMRCGIAITDLFSGMNATQAILAALLARAQTGVGQSIDIALLDSQVQMLANVASSVLVSGERPVRYGNAHATVVPYQVFEVADGSIALAIGNDRQFAILCARVFGRPELGTDPRYATNTARVKNRATLIPLMAAILATEPRAHWLKLLDAAGLPAGAIRTVDEVVTAPEVLARGMVKEVPHPTAGTISLVGSPLKLSGTPVREPVAPPLLGQHTDEVLTGLLGLSPERIAALKNEGVIRNRGD